MDDLDEKLLDDASESLLHPISPGSELQWCCLYTRPRHEKIVAKTCLDLETGCYLPLRRVTHHYKSGRKSYWLPLFSGYVFCCPNHDQRIELSRSERVLTVLDVKDQDQFVDELRQIYRGLQVSAELEALPYLAVGQHVEIVRGPFKGIRGVVERVKGGMRVMLTATMMNRSIPLEVDVGDVEPVD